MLRERKFGILDRRGRRCLPTSTPHPSAVGLAIGRWRAFKERPYGYTGVKFDKGILMSPVGNGFGPSGAPGPTDVNTHPSAYG